MIKGHNIVHNENKENVINEKLITQTILTERNYQCRDKKSIRVRKRKSKCMSSNNLSLLFVDTPTWIEIEPKSH